MTKDRLIICDLDETLWAHLGGSKLRARPFLSTFLRYVLHPETPFALAFWTFSGRAYGIAHMRAVNVGHLVFEDDKLITPRLVPGCFAFWGYEDSGSDVDLNPPTKNLEHMQDFINSLHARRHEHSRVTFGPWNTCLVDDQVTNASAQPDSLILAPMFTADSPDDDFLLQLVGFLDELSESDQMDLSLLRAEAFRGLDPEKAARYHHRALEVCQDLDIYIDQDQKPSDPSGLQVIRHASLPGPRHDCHADSLGGPCTSDYPIPTATRSSVTEASTPPRVAEGMRLAPTARYLREVSEPSRVGINTRPLLVFDIDGTLLRRPPHILEHQPDAGSQPAARPYLRCVLNWVLNYSGWRVAMWSGSRKSVVVRSLLDLDLGLVKPDGTPRHPHMVALWTREDFQLTRKDFGQWVAIVKDLDRLWDYLEEQEHTEWGPHNTVMVDDTPSKLRAQPYSLIVAPSFNYPLAPSSETCRYQLDTFLLQLVGQLDVLSTETNFADVISKERWFESPGGRNAEFVQRGIRVLKTAGLAIEAEGRGGISTSRKSRGHVIRGTALSDEETAAGHTQDWPEDLEVEDDGGAHGVSYTSLRQLPS